MKRGRRKEKKTKIKSRWVLGLMWGFTLLARKIASFFFIAGIRPRVGQMRNNWGSRRRRGCEMARSNFDGLRGGSGIPESEVKSPSAGSGFQGWRITKMLFLELGGWVNQYKSWGHFSRSRLVPIKEKDRLMENYRIYTHLASCYPTCGRILYGVRTKTNRLNSHTNRPTVSWGQSQKPTWLEASHTVFAVNGWPIRYLICAKCW